MIVNKYNIHWQVIRYKSKKMTNTKKRIAFVLEYLKEENSIENYERVKKWLRMSSYGFRNQYIKTMFSEALKDIEKLTYDKKDKPNDYSKYDNFLLTQVYNDVLHRKYKFQSNGPPEDHRVFIISLGTYLGIPQK